MKPTQKARAARIWMTLALAILAALAPAGAEAADLFNNTNTGGVSNGPRARVDFRLTNVAHIAEVVTYHWNNGHGATPGTISLHAWNGKVYGPFRAHGTSGQGGAPNVNWVATVNVDVPACMYNVIDSDPNTWSNNAQSQNRGFVIVRGQYLNNPKLASILSRDCPGGATGGIPGPPGRRPLPPRPNPPGPVAGGPQPGPAPQPCHRTTYAVAEMVPPCFGPTGTPITVILLRALGSPLAYFTFRGGNLFQIGQRTAPANELVRVTSPSPFRGNGTAVGSAFRFSAPAQLCMPGRGNWAWSLWLYDTKGQSQGAIDYFTITGC